MNENEASQKVGRLFKQHTHTTYARTRKNESDACVAEANTRQNIFHQTHTHRQTLTTCIYAILCVHSLNRTIIATWIPFNNFSRWTDYHPCLFSITIIAYTYNWAEQLPLFRATMLCDEHKLAHSTMYHIRTHITQYTQHSVSNIRWIKWICWKYYISWWICVCVWVLYHSTRKITMLLWNIEIAFGINKQYSILRDTEKKNSRKCSQIRHH